jgi:hypothetical protein
LCNLQLVSEIIDPFLPPLLEAGTLTLGLGVGGQLGFTPPPVGFIAPQFCPSAPYYSSGIGVDLGGYGFVLIALAGMDLRCDGGSGDVELFNGGGGLFMYSSKLFSLLCWGIRGPSRQCI